MMRMTWSNPILNSLRLGMFLHNIDTFATDRGCAFGASGIKAAVEAFAREIVHDIEICKKSFPSTDFF